MSKVVHGVRYKKTRGRMFALLVVIVLTIVALFFSRPEQNNFETRTADWATASFREYGLTISYPTELNLATDTTTLANLVSGEQWVEIKVFPNASEESPTDWTNRVYLVESQEVVVGDGVPAAQAALEWGGTVTIFEHQGRIIEVISMVEQQTLQDFLQSLFLAEVPPGTDVEGKARLLSLSDVAFKELFDSLLLPGTKQITEKPSITGDQAADAQIQKLAEARGYRLQADVAAELGAADGYSLQKQTAAAWVALQAAAADEGIALSVTSGYRSVASQQQIFTARLAAACAEVYGSNCSNDQIARGAADEAIDNVLKTSSIPGYSRHHSGHTVDIGQVGVGDFEDFFGTPGWDWISADNYANAKRFGFIPSYPPDAGLQGPDPEPWEYVFIGANYFLIGE